MKIFFPVPYFLLKGIPNLVLNFYSAYQRINKISEMNTRGDQGIQNVTPKRSIVVLLSDILWLDELYA